MSKFCPECNNETPDESSICLNCMHQFNEDSGQTKNIIAHLKTNKKAAAYMAAAICILIVLPVSISSIYSNPAPQTVQEQGSGKQKKSPIKSGVESLIDAIIPTTEVAAAPRSVGANAPSQSGTGTKKSNPAANNKSVPKASTSKNNSKKSGASAAAISGSKSANNSGNSSLNKKSTTAKSDESDNQTDKEEEKEEEQTTSPENSTPVLNYDDDKTQTVEKGIEITSYIGNDKNVLIPDKIDGKNVMSIASNAFKSSDVEYVTFKDSEKYHLLAIKEGTFKDCKSLKKLTLPKNTDLLISNMFVSGCTSMTEIIVDNWQYKFSKGGFYYNNTHHWSILYYCEGYNSEKYVVPDFCAQILCEQAFDNNKYLKELYLNDRNMSASYYYSHMEAIYAPDTNPYLYDINGVLFRHHDKGFEQLACYPIANKQKHITFPENCEIHFGYSHMNDYVESLTIPESSELAADSDIKNINVKFKSLKTIKIGKNHSQLQKFKDWFFGEIITY